MSQASVAQAVGTSQSAIARVESAQENITLDTLQRIVAALKGRFHVATPPQEIAPKPARAWWDSTRVPVTGSWTIVGYATRHVTGADQVVVGLERRRDQMISKSTLPATTTLLAGATTLLPAASTED